MLPLPAERFDPARLLQGPSGWPGASACGRTTTRARPATPGGGCRPGCRQATPVIAIGALARYDRPAPALEAYDQLLTGSGA